MIVKELSKKNMFKEYLIEIPYIEFSNSLDNKIKEMIPSVTLPGFRKGKAPLNIVKKKYENNVISEVMENIIQENTKKLLTEKKLKPIRQPKVEITKYKKDEPIELKLKIDLQPELILADFSKIKMKKYEIIIDQSKYEENYNNYVKSQQNYLRLENNRAVKKGDKIIVSIKSKDKLTPEFLQNQENVPIITDSDYQVLPDISNLLIGKKVKIGDTIKMNFDLKALLKTRKKMIAEFDIEIKSIEEKKSLVIDKDFLTKNNFDSEKKFKDKINKDFKNHYDNFINEIEKKQIFDLLESKHQFELPQGLLDEEFSQIWAKVENAKKDNKLDDDDKKLSDSKLKERYKNIAARRVKLAIVIQTIAEQYSITVNDKELTNGLLNYASQYPGQEKQIFDFFKKNPTQMNNIRGPIFENKVIETVFSKTTKEKQNISIDELNKLQEKTFSFNKRNL